MPCASMGLRVSHLGGLYPRHPHPIRPVLGLPQSRRPPSGRRGSRIPRYTSGSSCSHLRLALEGPHRKTRDPPPLRWRWRVLSPTPRRLVRPPGLFRWGARSGVRGCDTTSLVEEPAEATPLARSDRDSIGLECQSLRIQAHGSNRDLGTPQSRVFHLPAWSGRTPLVASLRDRSKDGERQDEASEGVRGSGRTDTHQLRAPHKPCDGLLHVPPAPVRVGSR